MGAQFVGAGTHKKVLVIGSDVMTSILDFKDRATCVLFGDGAGAVLLEPAASDAEGIIDFVARYRRFGRLQPLHARRRVAASALARDRRKADALRASGRASRYSSMRCGA